MPKISVILCTYNRAPYRQRALQALTRQSMPPGEFATGVVDDGSTDETPAVCERMAVALNGLRSFRIEPNIQFEPTNTCNLKCPLCPTWVRER